MSNAAKIEENPEWIPHRVDLNARRVEFLRIPSDQFIEPGFLADYQPASDTDRLVISIEEMLALRINDPAPLHFIFHTAFCRSTLLVKALNIESVSAGLAEPAIFASLASGGDAATPLVKPVLDLIGRQRAGTQATFVKPTNHSNRLIPQILQARPGTRAILMSNPIEAFLASVASKGMHGRRWGRNLFLEMQGYAGMDFGMDNRELFVMSDLQAAALAWFLNQNFFAALLEGPGGEHLRVLEGDVFNRQRTETLAATLRFAGIDCASDVAETAAQSPVFTKHSKLGGSVSDGERSERIDPDANVLQEIGQVAQWVGLIADQVDRSIPIAQTLFDPE